MGSMHWLLASVFSFQDAQYALSARGDIAIETVLHPTMIVPSNTNGQLSSYFVTYTDNSAFSAQSLSGDVVLNPRDVGFAPFYGPDVIGSSEPWYSILPPQPRCAR